MKTIKLFGKEISQKTFILIVALILVGVAGASAGGYWYYDEYVRDDADDKDDEVVEETKLSHVGIKNINRRLKLVYGEEYGFSIQSKCGEGTKVSLTIPYNHQE